MATWPSTLPKPQASGYALKPTQAFLRTNVDQGPARQRRRFSVVPTTIPVSFKLTLDQLATFEAWWHYEITDGAGWFTTTLGNGMGFFSCQARFTAAYEVSAVEGLNYTVTGTFEATGLPILTQLQLAPRL